MMAHITYLSEESMRQKFGRRIQDADEPRFGFGVDFQVESYLQHQGESFLKRFDANSYLYLTRVMDYFDPSPTRSPPRRGCGTARHALPRALLRHRLALRHRALA